MFTSKIKEKKIKNIKVFLYFTVILLLLLISQPSNSATIDGRFYPIFSSQNEEKKSITNFSNDFPNEVKVIFSSIDNILILSDKKNAEPQIPQSVKSAIEKLKTSDVQLILITEREAKEAKETVAKLDLKNIYIIGKNGNEIITPDDELIYQTKIKNKAQAVQNLSEILKKDLKNFAVIGNSKNDISMLKLIKKNNGAAISMQDSPNYVRKNSDYITLTASDDGFAKIIDEILKNNKRLKQ